mmetsp:Transcript_7012/g.17728  ORF Transcript_7012/g.17728 Transcript_7012/m.17728 type:complete len:223 (-) Transcript_7012:304-972(-)
MTRAGLSSPTSRYQWSLPTVCCHTPPTMADSSDMVSSSTRMARISRLSVRSSRLCLKSAPTEFSMILVSWPVYTATPTTQSVFCTLAPRSSRCVWASAKSVPPTCPVPTNDLGVSIWLLGAQQSMVPARPASWSSLSSPSVALGAMRCLRHASPSRLDVSMWQMPFFSDVESSTRSEGNSCPAFTRTMSPTTTSCHCTCSNARPRSTSVKERFRRRSSRKRL